MKNQGTIPTDQFLKMGSSKGYAQPAEEAQIKNTTNIIEVTKPFFKVTEKKYDEEGKEVEPEAAPPIGNMPDLTRDAKVWEWAGVNFGQYDMMLLGKSIKAHV